MGKVYSISIDTRTVRDKTLMVGVDKPMNRLVWKGGCDKKNGYWLEKLAGN